MTSFLWVLSGTLLLASSLMPLVNFFGMDLVKSIAELPGQLRDFRIQSADCFCCLNNHQDPHTGDELVCDRDLVFEALADLYHKQGEELHDKVNSEIQRRLRPAILSRIGGHIPLKYILCVVAVSNCPFISQVMSTWKRGLASPLYGLDYAIWCMRLAMEWFFPCLVILFSLHFSMAVHRCFKNQNSVLFSIGLTLPIGLAVATVWSCFAILNRLSEPQSMLPMVPFLLTCVLVSAPYFGRCRAAKRPRPMSDTSDQSRDTRAATVSTPKDWETWENQDDGDISVSWKF